MSVLVDTSVWSLALRRKRTVPSRETELLRHLLGESDESVCITGVILQEILQGVRDSEQASRIEQKLQPLVLLLLTREDYVHAARVFSVCRSRGLQISTADAQIAAVSLRYRCRLLTTDGDFAGIARYFPLRLA